MSPAAELSGLQTALLKTQRLLLGGSRELAFLYGIGEEWKGEGLSWWPDPALMGQWLCCTLLLTLLQVSFWSHFTQ